MTDPHQPPAASGGLVTAGYVTAILLPIVGFFVGLALIIKNRAGHGVAAMVLSVTVTSAALFLVLTVGGEPEAAGTTLFECLEQVDTDDPAEAHAVCRDRFP